MTDDDTQPRRERSTEELAVLDVLRLAVGPAVSWDTEQLIDTPARMLKALRELTSGYRMDPAAILARTFPAEGYDQIVVVRDVAFSSLCEHHVLPFTGKAHVAYIPDGKIVGLSKIPRVIEAFARRLQVQERLTRDIAESLERALAPRGVMVVVEGTHSCMALRGVRAQGTMVTSEVRGLFRSDDGARAEAMALFGK